MFTDRNQGSAPQGSTVSTVAIDNRPGGPRVDQRADRNEHQRDVYQARKEAGLCTRCGATAVDGGQYCEAHGGPMRDLKSRAIRAIRKRLRKAGRCRYCRRKSKTSRCTLCLAKEGGLPRSALPGNPRVDQTRTDTVIEADGYARKRYVGRARRGAPSRAVEDASSKRHADKAWEQWQAAHAIATDPSNSLSARDREQAAKIALEWLHRSVRHSAELLRRHGYDTAFVDSGDEAP